MHSIKASDLKAIQEEKDNSGLASSSTSKAIAKLAVDSAKKDIAMNQMVHAIAQLNIEIQKLKGEM